MTEIIYSEEFIRAIQKEFPNQDVNDLIYNNPLKLGRFISSNCKVPYSLEELVELLQNGEEQFIIDVTKTVIRREKLYNEWIKFISSSVDSIDSEEIEEMNAEPNLVALG